MICHISINNCRLDPTNLKENDLLSYRFIVDPKGGEICPKSIFNPYRDLRFTITESEVVKVAGSLHKYFNHGEYNYDDFSYDKLVKAILELCRDFGINPMEVALSSMEFGVNIELPFETRLFIDSLVTHKYKEFSGERDAHKDLKEVRYQQYKVKIYDKGLQNNLTRNLLRIEVKALKMSYIKECNIHTLWDLTDRNKLILLKKKLLGVFEDILFWDDSIDISSLDETERLIALKGCNPKYWAVDVKKMNVEEASRMKKKYKDLVKKYGKNHSQLVAQLIDEKWDSLMSEDEYTTQLLTEFSISMGNRPIQVLTGFQNPSSVPGHDGSSEPKVSSNTSFNHLSIGLKSVSTVSKDRICKVTGLDISMQKESSRFLCTSGLRYYLNNAPDIFTQLLLKHAAGWVNAPVEKQIEKIAHSIRNSFHNKRIYTQKRIKEHMTVPSLFNNWELISQEKKDIANR